MRFCDRPSPTPDLWDKEETLCVGLWGGDRMEIGVSFHVQADGHKETCAGDFKM